MKKIIILAIAILGLAISISSCVSSDFLEPEMLTVAKDYPIQDTLVVTKMDIMGYNN